jgi:hypothetical protein
VGAVGNGGGLPIHLGYTLSSDTNFTWFTSASGAIYVQLWADTNNFNAADFAIGVTRNSDYADLDRTAFTDIQSNLFIYTYDTLWNTNGQRIATIMGYGSTQGTAYSMEYLISPDSLVGYNYGLFATGAGHFDCWSFNFFSGSLPMVAQYPAIIDYRNPDIQQTMVSSFQCSPRVICVGNYVNRDEWPNYLGTITYDTTVTAGELMYNSSVGPTRDGRIKPEITAPGANDISCIETNSQAAIIAGAPTAVTPGGWHVVGGGSSASSPVVAGIGALWLERFPNATWQEYRAAVIWCAKQDTFTGTALPNAEWGYGKADAWSMMANCASSMSIQEQEQSAGIAIYPVPATSASQTVIQLNAAEIGTTVEIFNAAGQLVYTTVTDRNGKAYVPAGYLSGGMYCAVAVTVDGRASAKFVVE